MAKYQIAIQKQIPDYPVITVEFEEKTRKEAIARSRVIFQEVAEQYSKGEYKGKLYRKFFLLDWCRVLTPEFACTINSK